MADESECLLDPPFGRPKTPSFFTGQQLFIQGDDWHNNAMLGWTHFPADLYAIGYKEAADGLLQAIADRKVSLDSGIYPLVFLYRHALELQLKLILPLARRIAGESHIDEHRHELMPMWRALRRLLTEIAPEAEDNDLLAMESFIQQLSDVDPSSFAFRYSTGKRGDVSLPGLQHINIRHLSEILDSVFMMFDGIYSWLGEMETNNPYY